MSTRTSRAINGTLTSFIQFSVRIILQAALSPLVLKVAGQETLGAYSILMQVIGYMALLDLGFGVALSRYLAQANGYDDNGKQFRDVFETGRTYFLFYNFLFALLVLILSYFIGRVFSFSHGVEIQAQYGLWVLACWGIVRVPFVVYGGALTAKQNLAANNVICTVGNMLRIVFSLGAVIAGMGLLGLMLSNVVSEATMCILQRWYYHKLYPNESYRWGIPSWQLFSQMIKFGLGFFFVIVGGRLSLQSDNLVVGLLYGSEKTSIYYTTQMPAFLLIALVWMIVDNAGPALHELYARKNVARLHNSYIRLLKYNLLCGFALAIGLLVFNRHLVTLWVGAAQYAGDLMTISLSVFAVATTVNHVNGYFIGVYGAVRYLSIVSVVGGIANLILSLILGRIIGIEGVMVASAVIEVMVVVMFWVYCLRLLDMSFNDVLRRSVVPAIAANCFAIPVVVYVLKGNIVVTLSSFILWSFIFMAIWAIGTITAGLDREELAQIRGYLGRIVIAGR